MNQTLLMQQDSHGPRTVIIPRTANGFGFTLRHFIVYPSVTEMTAAAARRVCDMICFYVSPKRIHVAVA